MTTMMIGEAAGPVSRYSRGRGGDFDFVNAMLDVNEGREAHVSSCVFPRKYIPTDVVVVVVVVARAVETARENTIRASVRGREGGPNPSREMARNLRGNERHSYCDQYDGELGGAALGYRCIHWSFLSVVVVVVCQSVT